MNRNRITLLLSSIALVASLAACKISSLTADQLVQINKAAKSVKIASRGAAVGAIQADFSNRARVDLSVKAMDGLLLSQDYSSEALRGAVLPIWKEAGNPLLVVGWQTAFDIYDMTLGDWVKTGPIGTNSTARLFLEAARDGGLDALSAYPPK